MEGKLIKQEDKYYALYNTEGTFISDVNGGSIANKLSLKNCQAIENGNDLDELAKKHYDVHIKQGHTKEDSLQRKIDFILGFQKALEILGNKKFTEVDVIAMIEKSRETGLSAEYLILTKQQTEWDVEIVMEEDCPFDYTSRCTQGRCDCKKPKCDSNGCLILKRK